MAQACFHPPAAGRRSGVSLAVVTRASFRSPKEGGSFRTPPRRNFSLWVHGGYIGQKAAKGVGPKMAEKLGAPGRT